MGICAPSARHTNLRVSMSVPLSILYLLIINLMEFLKVWAEHNFYHIRYISVYIQPRYFYLIFRSVNGNNMNRVILHSVRPSFWKKRDFSHAPRCGSTESGCEISDPWWWILADRGKMTCVWSRDRDTGDTSEIHRVYEVHRRDCIHHQWFSRWVTWGQCTKRNAASFSGPD